jgi:GTP-binding protein YchF
MKVGIIGLPRTGKTTLFKALIKKEVPISFENPNVGSVKVIDYELDKLSSIFHPKKTIPAEISFVDIPGIPVGIENKRRRTEIYTSIKKVDALVEVVDDFSGLRDTESSIKEFDADLIIIDLDVVERRLERLRKEKRDAEKEREKTVLEKCFSILNSEKPLRDGKLSEEEKHVVKSFEFFTLKPVLYVINISDDKIGKRDEIREFLVKKFLGEHFIFIVMPVKLELELSELSEDDKKEFLSSYGLEKQALPEFIDAAYLLLNYETFYTVVNDEVKAWTITKGTNARSAAGKVHSDIERGFIAAEVISFEEFEKVGFSLKEAREKGILRIEGEHYIVKNKEVVHFRFNI